MSILSSSAAPNGQPPRGFWSTIATYVVNPFTAASVAILPVFRDLIAKSAQQIGTSRPRITFTQGVRQGRKDALKIGGTVMAQSLVQQGTEHALIRTGIVETENMATMLAGSAVSGTLLSPALAIINGRTMELSVRDIWQRFSAQQCKAIAFRETFFVAGLAASKYLATPMKRVIGDNKVTEYCAAWLGGVFGSLAGHPADTALTRLQNGMPFEWRTSMRGALTKARGIGLFAVLYKGGKDILNTMCK